MLQRMRELAVQAGNATNSKSDREALNAELVQLRDEVDRVAKTTSFNGKKVLDGSFTGGVFQVGANSGDNITVGALANTKVTELGKANYGTGVGTAFVTNDKNVAATAMTNADVTITIVGAGGGAGVTAVVAKDPNITGDEALGRMIQAINSKTADTGVVAFLNDAGNAIEYRATVGEGEDATAVVISADVADANTLIELTAGIDASSKGIDKMDIKTQATAWESLQRIDSAIDKVNTARGELGAIQTRFEKTVENIDIQNENLTAARGRVVDADFAQETANLSRTQILQQAGTAMVAQANQLPQQVLSLLR